MRPRRALPQARFGLSVALAAALAGLLAAPGAHAALPTITGAVVSADPGPIVEGSVYFATTESSWGSPASDQVVASVSPSSRTARWRAG